MKRQPDGTMVPTSRKIAFTQIKPPGTATTPVDAGQRALVFESDPKQPVPLFQRPGDVYRFSFNDGSNSYFLPYANSDLIKPVPVDKNDPDGKKKVFSDIYVYL